jgi:hypothetical protein
MDPILIKEESITYIRDKETNKNIIIYPPSTLTWCCAVDCNGSKDIPCPIFNLPREQIQYHYYWKPVKPCIERFTNLIALFEL